jgi:hypothetical protein
MAGHREDGGHAELEVERRRSVGEELVIEGGSLRHLRLSMAGREQQNQQDSREHRRSMPKTCPQARRHGTITHHAHRT